MYEAKVIQATILPLGQLSEEAQEARNRDCKKYGEGNTRKCSRRNAAEDLPHMLVLSSDPVISQMATSPNRGGETFVC
jgi:hypothetical protein